MPEARRALDASARFVKQVSAADVTARARKAAALPTQTVA
jgi:hypothetical protein